MNLSSLFNSKIESLTQKQSNEEHVPNVSALSILKENVFSKKINDSIVVINNNANDKNVNDFISSITKKNKIKSVNRKDESDNEKAEKLRNNINDIFNNSINSYTKKKPQVIERIVEPVAEVSIILKEDNLELEEHKVEEKLLIGRELVIENKEEEKVKVIEVEKPIYIEKIIEPVAEVSIILKEDNLELEAPKVEEKLLIGRGLITENKLEENVKVVEVEKPIYIEKIVEKIVLDDRLNHELDQVKELNSKYLNVINQLNDELLLAKVPSQKPQANTSEIDTLKQQVVQLTSALNYVNNVNKTLNQRLVRAI